MLTMRRMHLGLRFQQASFRRLAWAVSRLVAGSAISRRNAVLLLIIFWVWTWFWLTDALLQLVPMKTLTFSGQCAAEAVILVLSHPFSSRHMRFTRTMRAQCCGQWKMRR